MSDAISGLESEEKKSDFFRDDLKPFEQKMDNNRPRAVMAFQVHKK